MVLGRKLFQIVAIGNVFVKLSAVDLRSIFKGISGNLAIVGLDVCQSRSL